MKRLLSLHKLVIGLTIFLLLFVAGAQPVHACILGFIGTDCEGLPSLIVGLAADVVNAIVSVIVTIINTFIGWIAWLAFQVATWIIDFALQINSQLANSAVIAEGFNTVLVIANLAIVVSIVVIAFMVMLRRGEAGKLLTRFIIVAILINFGYTIVIDLVIEPVDLITRSIVQATNFGPTTFAGAFVPQDFNIGGIFGDERVLSPPEGSSIPIDAENELAGLGFNVTVSIASVLFSIAFLVIGTIVLFGFAGVLFIRYIALGLLIILLPIAWVSWIFPNLKVAGGHPFGQWWSSFIKWTLFAPISVFFFWLAVKSINQDALNVPQTNFAAAAGAVIGDMVIVIGLLVGGMIVAQKMSIIGAGAIVGQAKKVGVYARKQATDRISREVAKGTVRALNRPIVKKRLQDLSSIGTKSDFAQRKILGFPVRAMGAPLRAAGKGSVATAQRGESFLLKQAKDKYQNYAPYRLKALLEQENLPRIERMAIQSIMQEKGSSWETNIGQHAARMYEKGEFAKFGGQKTQIDMLKEGLDPRVISAISRSGETDESIGALMRARYDKLEDSAITNIGSSILADYDPDVEHYGFTPEQHGSMQRAFLNYVSQDRAQVLTKVRGKQTRSGKANLNKAAQKRLHSGVTATILKQDKKDRIKFVSDKWEGPKGIKQEEIKRRIEAIDAIKDTKFSDKDRKEEKTRITAHIESLGAEGYLGEIHALDNSQKDIYSTLIEGTSDADTATPTPTADTT